MLSKSIYIYALKDSTGIRYIGKTSYPKKRLGEHLRPTKGISSYKKNWIAKCKIQNDIPKMMLLHKCDNEEQANKLEISLIAHYKQFCKLVNGTDGGEGALGTKRSKESKMKASKRMATSNPMTKIAAPAYQYSLEGAFIKEWQNARKASLALNINYRGVLYCIKGKDTRYSHSGGFIWRNFKVDNLVKHTYIIIE